MVRREGGRADPEGTLRVLSSWIETIQDVNKPLNKIEGDSRFKLSQFGTIASYCQKLCMG